MQPVAEYAMRVKPTDPPSFTDGDLFEKPAWWWLGIECYTKFSPCRDAVRAAFALALRSDTHAGSAAVQGGGAESGQVGACQVAIARRGLAGLVFVCESQHCSSGTASRSGQG